ncbi:hypothetical protein DSCA_32760 [Desulfosarcina alkanivorans]|uniref:Uncharacterized protein n=1 Tax=Desulfosarcina alkanivorans TaxID=571177 RepID=A0A5K7YJG9_9BACT|nr:hypothetical protein [Desulfosarcina alkanivorans]BBO69346.1 hypothetical protein DSCA_32760 [Desulfosarcina alkanivorans]
MDTVRLNIDGSIDTIRKDDQPALLACLARQVELAPEYTLRSFFSMLDAYGALVHLNAFFPDLMEQCRQGPADGCRVDAIDWLMLEKTVEMIGFPGEPRLEIYRSFSGCRQGKSVPIKEFQVDMLLDMQVRLGRLKHVIFGDQVDVFEFDTVFTLFELVEGIGWELGFHGTPRECQIGSFRK